MAAITHDLPSLLEETAQITDRAFVVLQVETDYGADLIAEAFPGLTGAEADILEKGALILSCDDDDQGRRTFERVVEEAYDALNGRHCDLEDPILSTVTFVGRANEGEASRTGVMTLVVDVSGSREDPRPRFTNTGHLLPR